MQKNRTGTEGEKIMIRIGKYGIDTTERCYAIGKIRKTTDKKTGEEMEVLDNPGYYTTFSSALLGLHRRISLDAVAAVDGDLLTAITAVQKHTKDFEEVVKAALPLPRLPKE